MCSEQMSVKIFSVLTTCYSNQYCVCMCVCVCVSDMHVVSQKFH